MTLRRTPITCPFLKSIQRPNCSSWNSKPTLVSLRLQTAFYPSPPPQLQLSSPPGRLGLPAALVPQPATPYISLYRLSAQPQCQDTEPREAQDCLEMPGRTTDLRSHLHAVCLSVRVLMETSVPVNRAGAIRLPCLRHGQVWPSAMLVSPGPRALFKQQPGYSRGSSGTPSVLQLKACVGRCPYLVFLVALHLPHRAYSWMPTQQYGDSPYHCLSFL